MAQLPSSDSSTTPPSLMTHLEEPFRTALVELVDWVRATLGPTGIVVSGTIVRGNPSPTSDFDVVVIHDEPWRQRVQRWFNGVPAEFFINPPHQIRAQMEADTRAGRPVMAHMLATGVAVWDPAGTAAGFQAEARRNLEAGPTVSGELLRLRQYGVATMFEDAVDIVEVDPERSRSLVVQSLVEAIQWYFLSRGRWLPRPKALLSDLEVLDAGPGRSVRAAIREPDLKKQIELASGAIDAIIGHTGFFAWEGERQPRPYPQDTNPAAPESSTP